LRLPDFTVDYAHFGLFTIRMLSYYYDNTKFLRRPALRLIDSSFITVARKSEATTILENVFVYCTVLSYNRIKYESYYSASHS